MTDLLVPTGFSENESIRKDHKKAGLIRKIRNNILGWTLIPLTALNILTYSAAIVDMANHNTTSAQIKNHGLISKPGLTNYIIDGAGYFGSQIAAENVAREEFKQKYEDF